MPTSHPLLTVENLHVDFGVGPSALHAVRGVSFTVGRGETLGIVGESGSGKSVTALSILRLIAPPGRITQGRIHFSTSPLPSEERAGSGEGPGVRALPGLGEGLDLLKIPEKALCDIRGSRIAMVFQDPLTSLNPTLTIGDQIVETILEHRGTHPASFLGTPPEAGREGVKKKVTKKEAWAEAESLLRQVHMTLPERRMRQYPFELSGGMRQRAMIAMAFSCRPELLIADEPTTALDVTVQAQILDLMDELRHDYGTSVILITHDLGVVSERCDNVAVMYAGQIVEYAPTRELFDNPRHPYTQALLASLPDWRRPRTNTPLPTLPGQPPSLTSTSPGPSSRGELSNPGCPFAPRCPQVMGTCSTTTPGQTYVNDRHYARCLRLEGETDATENS